MVDRLCPGSTAPVASDRRSPPRTPRQPPDPPRERWHAEPQKVFDNLYFVGMTEFASWAVTTTDGIIVIDPLFDYSVEDEVVGGLRKLGFDPADIRYVLISHGHLDHAGGAKLLQQRFGARLLMSAADWDLVERDNPRWKPARDLVITDGQKLTLGDTALTMYLTPGHTNGTVSTLIPLTDHGEKHVAALWGGTLFNFAPDAARFKAYADSALRMRDARGERGRRCAALESHRLRWLEDQAARAREACARRAECVCRWRRLGAPLPHGCERMRAGGARDLALMIFNASIATESEPHEK